MAKRKMRKTPKPKLPTYTRIDRESDTAIYEILDRLVKTTHKDLADAEIALAWRQGWKSNKDGQLILGRCRKASELDKQYHKFDFVIILNKEAWAQLDASQRKALMDHELCHATVAEDQNGNIKEDARGRKMYRTRKHDIEEFRGVIERHGCYKKDLEDFCLAALNSKKPPPQPALPGMDDPATIPMPAAAKKTGAAT